MKTPEQLRTLFKLALFRAVWEVREGRIIRLRIDYEDPALVIPPGVVEVCRMAGAPALMVDLGPYGTGSSEPDRALAFSKTGIVTEAGFAWVYVVIEVPWSALIGLQLPAYRGLEPHAFAFRESKEETPPVQIRNNDPSLN